MALLFLILVYQYVGRITSSGIRLLHVFTPRNWNFRTTPFSKSARMPKDAICHIYHAPASTFFVMLHHPLIPPLDANLPALPTGQDSKTEVGNIKLDCEAFIDPLRLPTMPGKRILTEPLMWGEADKDAGQKRNRIYARQLPKTRQSTQGLNDILEPKPKTSRILGLLKAVKGRRPRPI
ncbi:hypothetical protein F5Y06DRAFT_248461 [Hypoxylon sp. FL0890]|nr:hypothetical protein F5Y06DRAFT_248461 [Hypoxylon sp. FL0890]